MERFYEDFWRQSHARWKACGFDPDGTFIDPSPAHRIDDIETWRCQLQEQDEEEWQQLTNTLEHAALIIQQAWRARTPKKKPEVFLLM